MRYCPQCGQMIDDGARFCGHCGAVVTAAAEPQMQAQPQFQQMQAQPQFQQPQAMPQFQHPQQPVFPQTAIPGYPGYPMVQMPVSQNPYDAARMARGTGDLMTAYNCYQELLQNHPEDWESVFYSKLYELMVVQAPEEYKIEEARLVTLKALELAAIHIQNPIDRDTIVLELLSQSRNYLRQLHKQTLEDERSHLIDHGKLVIRDWHIGEALIEIADCTEQYFGTIRRIVEAAVHNWKFAVILKQDRLKELPDPSQEKERIEHYLTKIRIYDPAYLVPKTWIGIGNIFTKTT